MSARISFDLLVLDAADIGAEARFYADLLGWSVTDESADWITVRGESGAGLAFQLAPDHRPPSWPDESVPQQAHLDLTVDDLDAAEARALELGARRTGLPDKPDSSFRVYLDPAGHPFCLCAC